MFISYFRTGYRRINVYMSPAVYYTAVLTCCYGYNGEPPNCEGAKIYISVLMYTCCTYICIQICATLINDLECTLSYLGIARFMSNKI